MNNFKSDYEKSLFEKCTRIKFLVQQFSGVQDIGIKSRKREIADMKKVYCKICKETTKASLSLIGEALNGTYDHASVLHSVTEFDKLYNTKQLCLPEVYKDTLDAIEQLKQIDTKEETTSRLIVEYVSFLNWFRKEINDETPIETSFFVGKYFALSEDN